MKEKIKDSIMFILKRLFDNEAFNQFPDVENYFLTQIGIGCLIVFISFINLIVTHNWKLSILIIAILLYLAIKPISYYRQVKNNKIMIYEGIVMEFYDNTAEKGIKGSISRSYKRKYINVSCNGLLFTIYMNSVKDMAVGDTIRLYCNPEYAIAKNESHYIINDYLLCYKTGATQS